MVAARNRCSAQFMWTGVFAVCLLATCLLSGCEAGAGGDAALTSQTYFELVDWHISGFWVINCPVAWVRIKNFNQVPIKDITFQYNTYDWDGTPLDQGTYTIEGTVPAASVKNFPELYVGMVNLHSEKLSTKLLSVKADSGGGGGGGH
ncbi:MAG: hypothetical protein JST89_12300 [Cyanobacteria bacterium SZAS-4]|nr:hypothetical protein [Cyanobacteria bacterium SZAS-4]